MMTTAPIQGQCDPRLPQCARPLRQILPRVGTSVRPSLSIWKAKLSWNSGVATPTRPAPSCGSSIASSTGSCRG
jgi:hypothetical protein